MQGLKIGEDGSSGMIQEDMSVASPSPSSSHDSIDCTATGDDETDQCSNDEYESSQSETASEILDALEDSRSYLQYLRHEHGTPGMTELWTSRLSDDFMTLDSFMSQEVSVALSPQTQQDTLNDGFALPETLPPPQNNSTQTSVPRPPHNLGTDPTSIGKVSSKALGRRGDLPTDELSSTSSVTTRYPASLRGSYHRGWIFPEEAAAWSAAMQVGCILDVRDSSGSHFEGKHSVPDDDARRRKTIKRLVVVGIKDDFVCGVPVRTYRERGVTDLSDSQRNAHAILYAQGAASLPLSGEPGMDKRPLLAKMSSSVVSLKPSSRINFARTCVLGSSTVIYKIGKVDRLCIDQLREYWTEHLHPVKLATEPKLTAT